MQMTRLCVTVTGKDTAELRARRDAAREADLVEVRVDTVRDPSAAGALQGRQTPVVFTCRPQWEGGAFAGSEDERRRLLDDAQSLGAEYVDVEWRAGFDDLLTAREGRGIVLSRHDFDGVPADVAGCLAAMQSTGAEVVKLAVMARQLRDCLPLLAIGRRAATPVVLIAMGDAGMASRVLAARFGSCWTYAGDHVAPGQVSSTRMLDEFAFRRIHAGTSLYGVVGRPVMHSVSPTMHNTAFRAIDRDAVYLPLAAADFGDFLEFADAIGVEGASVTAPFKLDAFACAGEHDATSARLRSANTLRRHAGRWAACNTDVAGFLGPLDGAMALQDRRAVVLGGGGAARAVADALVAAGAHVAIAARRREQAARTAQLSGAQVTDWPPAPGSWDLLVNATPRGTVPNVDETPLPRGPFTGELVYDLVYNPPETQLLRDARAAGCRTIGGLEMLVAQAELQFAWWTGRQPPRGVMREAALRALDGETPPRDLGL